MKTIGIIGGGNMGAAIAGRIRGAFKVVVCEQDAGRRASLKRKFKTVFKDLPELVKVSDAIIVAVKPQDIEGVLSAMKQAGADKKLVISIAAGITTAYLERRLGPGSRVVRTMPNMPAMIGEGVTAVAGGRRASKADVAKTLKIFSRVGETVVIGEKGMDAVTAVSGSGPAYVFLFAEILRDAALSLGLDARVSEKLVTSTLLGSAHLLAGQKDDPSALRARVTSKGGTTQAATDVFMKHRIGGIFQEALTAARDRARKLAKK
ncbi:MAG: pyrroline-5-carboxylate reductase [Candidatus Omnitrophota bacterium]|nr:pyrroline-5-carboxylate reductase [Candidatus Omnitrophota bacterium]MDZ4241892.1 pyrroline-5-carboxylate reductase [Candidatus Omnitrophota bacterium]